MFYGKVFNRNIDRVHEQLVKNVLKIAQVHFMNCFIKHHFFTIHKLHKVKEDLYIEIMNDIFSPRVLKYRLLTQIFF